jgi:hypothetical protein
MKKLALVLAIIGTLGIAACGKSIPQDCDKPEKKTQPECIGA